MEVKAEAKYIRMSPRKIRLVVEAIKKLPPAKALVYLRFLSKRASRPLIKVIESALANAQDKHQRGPDEWRFKTIQVMKGPIYKRWRPVSRGRAHPINKRTSHIRVVLQSKTDNR